MGRRYFNVCTDVIDGHATIVVEYFGMRFGIMGWWWFEYEVLVHDFDLALEILSICLLGFGSFGGSWFRGRFGQFVLEVS